MSSIKLKKAWRDAATLIIAAKCTNPQNLSSKFDYRILCMKRSEKTSFMSNHLSFPGGALEEQDQLPNWLDHFSKLGVTRQQLDTLTLDYHKKKLGDAFIFQDEQNSKTLPRSVSLRINAIREAFEELGVLLCKKPNTSIPLQLRESATYLRDIDIPLYQQKVHSRQITFLELCQQLNVIPDIFSLYEWSAWLTPTFFASKRFQTAFFICTLRDQPPICPEPNEAYSYFWRDPVDYIKMLKNDVVWYHPPQLYEFSRIGRIREVNKLQEFIAKRECKGTPLFMPSVFKCEDGMAFTLPGDQVYPEHPKYIEDDVKLRTGSFNGTMKQFREVNIVLNRIEIKSPSEVELYSNCEPNNGHMTPLTNDEIMAEIKTEENLKSKM